MKYEKNALFSEGDNLDSTYFRIPFLIKTNKGTTIAGTDVNFGSNGDSAEKICAAVRRRELKNETVDYAKGWDESFIPNCLHLRDFPDAFGYQQESTSFIDGMIAQDYIGVHKKGRLFIIIDAWAWNGGMIERMIKETVPPIIYSKGKDLEYVYRLGENIIGDGFATINGKKYLLLSSKNIKKKDELTNKDTNKNIVRANFDFVADIYGEKKSDGGYNIYHLNGIPNEYCEYLDDSNLSLGDLSVYSLSENYDLLQNDQPLTCKQENTGKVILVNILYKLSPLQVFNTAYHYSFISDDDGITWRLDKNISGMIRNDTFKYFLTAPGRGIQISKGKYAGRLVFPIYFYDDGREKMGTIYSDNGGQTFKNGEELKSEKSLSESTMIELPNGDLQFFIRNRLEGGKVISATNVGGEKFIHESLKSAFLDNEEGVGCQVSAVNLTKKVVSKKDGNKYDAIVVSTPNRRERDNGKLFIGLIKQVNNKFEIDFEYNYDITQIDHKYGYSSLAEIREDVVGLLYEDAPTNDWADGLHRMMYKEININDLIKGN